MKSKIEEGVGWQTESCDENLTENLFRQCCGREPSSTEHKSRCCSVSSECDPVALPMPPGPQSSRPPRHDFEAISEKYWGEILERTVSSSSLQALQRTYGQHHLHSNHHQSHKTSVIDLNNSHGNCHNSKQQMHDGIVTGGTNLSNFSNSEPRLCEHYHHDINCAKNKSFLNDSRHSIKGLPDI